MRPGSGTRFWVCLVLTVPVVVCSELAQEWLGFTPSQFPGSGWVAPVVGTVVFVDGGWPFLEGGLDALAALLPERVTSSGTRTVPVAALGVGGAGPPGWVGPGRRDGPGGWLSWRSR
jgi:cation transport ATPase